MFLIPVAIIVAWIVFWLGRTLYIYNKEEFYYKYKKLCRKTEKPMLFHAEVFASLMWCVMGLGGLYMFLQSSI